MSEISNSNNWKQFTTRIVRVGFSFIQKHLFWIWISVVVFGLLACHWQSVGQLIIEVNNFGATHASNPELSTPIFEPVYVLIKTFELILHGQHSTYMLSVLILFFCSILAIVVGPTSTIRVLVFLMLMPYLAYPYGLMNPLYWAIATCLLILGITLRFSNYLRFDFSTTTSRVIIVIAVLLSTGVGSMVRSQKLETTRLSFWSMQPAHDYVKKCFLEYKDDTTTLIAYAPFFTSTAMKAAPKLSRITFQQLHRYLQVLEDTGYTRKSIYTTLQQYYQLASSSSSENSVHKLPPYSNLLLTLLQESDVAQRALTIYTFNKIVLPFTLYSEHSWPEQTLKLQQMVSLFKHFGWSIQRKEFEFRNLVYYGQYIFRPPSETTQLLTADPLLNKFSFSATSNEDSTELTKDQLTGVSLFLDRK